MSTLPPGLFRTLAIKRSIFVSYYHDQDQRYYDTFSTTFSETYGIVRDNSLDRVFDSDDTDYVMQRIRDKHITGTSCTIVLCGPMTPWRKYVDWEIKATLDKEHGLIGINLPENLAGTNGKVIVPDRLYDNIVSGYATWMTWGQLTQGGPAFLKSSVEAAIAKPKNLINNTREMRSRNGK
jgi:hypothetical protein